MAGRLREAYGLAIKRSRAPWDSTGPDAPDADLLPRLEFSRPGLLAVAVALQHFGADGFFDLLGRRFDLVFQARIRHVIAALCRGEERINHSGLGPLIELLHEARCFCFGHMFVPFRQE